MAGAEGKEENATKDDAQQKECDHVMESDLSIAIDNLSLSSEWLIDDSTTVLPDRDPGSVAVHLVDQIHTT